LVRFQVRGEILEGASCRRAGFRDLLTQRAVLVLCRDALAQLPRGRLRLTDRAVDVHGRHEREINVGLSVGDVFGDGEQSCARRLGEVTLRPESVEEERENATERWVQIGIRLALPVEAWLRELASPQRREDDVAVDTLVRREGVVGDASEALGPLEDARIAPAKGLGGEIFRALVVLGEAEHAGPGRGFLVALGEVVLDERRKRRGRHDATSPTMAKVTD